MIINLIFFFQPTAKVPGTSRLTASRGGTGVGNFKNSGYYIYLALFFILFYLDNFS